MGANNRALPIAGLLTLEVAVAACSPSTFCTGELRTAISPNDTTIAVGGTFTPTIKLSTCGGNEILTDTFTFVSTAPEVATVDSLSGLVTGEAEGQADIEVSGKRYLPVYFPIAVTVVPGA